MPIGFLVRMSPVNITYPQILFSHRISATLFGKVAKKKVKTQNHVPLAVRGGGRTQLGCVLANANP